MTVTDPTIPPVVPPRVRTIVYVTSLIVNVATILVLDLAVVFELMPAQQATAAAGVILGSLGLLTAGLGVAYRPTRTLP